MKFKVTDSENISTVFLNGEKITVSEVCDLMDAKILDKKIGV